MSFGVVRTLVHIEKEAGEICMASSSSEGILCYSKRVIGELVSPSVLAHPDYSLQFDSHCDASTVGVGAMLALKGKPIAFASRVLNATENNCSITER